MKVRKIRRDAGPEDLACNPPNLCFSIDRHGGTVMGSKRAERQTWTLNLETLTAMPGLSGIDSSSQIHRNWSRPLRNWWEGSGQASM